MRHSCLRYSQENKGIARRQEHGSCQGQHSDTGQQPGCIFRPAPGCMVLGKKPKAVCDQPCYDNKIRDRGNPVLKLHLQG